MPTATCARCHTVIEPLLSEQWFVRMKELAQPAIDVVKEGRVKFVPERYERTYLDWMENIRDWTISRQLWWGHRIPVWTTEDGEYIVARSEEEAREKAGGRPIKQDEDVLDTWFSSALWPHAVLGWPERSRRPRTLLPDVGAHHRARHHIPLGVANDHDRDLLQRRDSLLRRLHLRDGARRAGQARRANRSARASTRST